ncbi:response regulator [Spirosoma koreense]
MMKSKASYSPTNVNFTAAKVLIVDDNADQWALIRPAMQQCMPEVEAVYAPTAEQALALLEQWQTLEWEVPKLILLDLYLPYNANGWHVLKAIKAFKAPIDQIPVIVFSSSASAVDIATSYSLGASAYVVKPTQYEDWMLYFTQIRAYWWETASLPIIQYNVLG